MKTKRLTFTLPEMLYEKLRKEAYNKRTVKGEIVRQSLEVYFSNKK